MRFLLRSDAGVIDGTGHVMRCITLAEELVGRGHSVELRGATDGLRWLEALITESGAVHTPVAAATLDVPGAVGEGWDAVVVDSYRIAPGAIAELDDRVPVLAIVDGDDRGLRASAYLDPNPGAELIRRPGHVAGSLLAGSDYVLVRSAVRALRRSDRWRTRPAAHVLAFMGGNDPVGAMPRVAASLARLPQDVRLTLVTAPPWRDEVVSLLGGRKGADVIDPTPRLPELMSDADLVVSATGTSAWDLCTMGVPSVFAAIVDNQRAGLRSIAAGGLGLSLDAATDPDRLDGVGDLVAATLADEPLRRTQVERCLAAFDGRGAERVADELERLDGSTR